MFGLSLYSELLHGSALRTWNCVAHVACAFWNNVVRRLGVLDNMPRSRRRHHSRSRSRSNSHDRDREPKRRKVESFESPHNRRSVSSEPEAKENVAKAQNDYPVENLDAHSHNIPANDTANQQRAEVASSKNAADAANTSKPHEQVEHVKQETVEKRSAPHSESDLSLSEEEVTFVSSTVWSKSDDQPASAATPSTRLTPKQLQKKLDSARKKEERQREKDERNRAKQLERDKKLQQKQTEKDARDARAKEERDDKERAREAKRREKEERDEVKRKEREAVMQKKQAEVEEKNREKQRLEEKKQKAAAAFTKFFVTKPLPTTGCDIKLDTRPEEGYPNAFMPFQLKSDMQLAPITRNRLTLEEKQTLEEELSKQKQQLVSNLYLQSIKTQARKQAKVQPPEPDVICVHSDVGEGILNGDGKIGEMMKAKYLKFHENQRPPYYGTWRKKSKTIRGRCPFARDGVLNYEVDSDDEWEEEEEGEDIAGSDDEEKEPDSENDYEVDNEFFVPHGHLSDDEENDDEKAIAPEMRKAKEKLLRNQFDEERKLKTQRLKPRVIGCAWYGKDNEAGDDVDAATDQLLRPYTIIANRVISIKKRSEFEVKEKRKWRLEKEFMPDLLRLLHGNVHSKRILSTEFIEYLSRKNVDVVPSKFGLWKLIKSVAKWGKCKMEGPMFNKMCWLVTEDTLTEYNHVVLSMPNTWQYCIDTSAKDSCET